VGSMSGIEKIIKDFYRHWSSMNRMTMKE